MAFLAWYIAVKQKSTAKRSTTGYWQNVIQKELLASKAQYADVVETLSPSSEPTKPVEAEHETVMPMSAPQTPATSVEVAHETVEPPAESTPALPEPPKSTSQEEHFSIEKPAMPQPVISKSIASPSSVAHVMVQKYQQSMPLYRQDREWKEIGILLSRTTLANWVIRLAEDWLMPLVQRLQERFLEQDVMPSAGHMHGGTSSRPSLQTCRKKTSSAARTGCSATPRKEQKPAPLPTASSRLPRPTA